MEMLAALVEWSSRWTIVMFAALALAIILGTWAGAVAGRKGRSTQLWFILGFLFPVIGLVIIYSLKPVKPAEGGKKE